MITVKVGNIFESNASTLVNAVNCVGVMGKGLALEFKKRYPEMFRDYVARCADGMVKPGLPYLYRDLLGISILNFPTKDHWRGPSKLSYVTDGLKWFIHNYEELNITSIAFRALGCGNGGLEWSLVGPIVYGLLGNLLIDIEIYAPYGTSPELSSAEYLESKFRYFSSDRNL